MPDDTATTAQPASPGPAAPDRAPDARRIAVILNPGSGTMRSEPDRAGRIERAFGDRARILRIGDDGPVKAAERAADKGATCLVAAGGDGTIAAVAQVASDRGLEMGVIPGGTFNYVARGYGIPENPEAAARMILDGTARPVDLGDVGGRVFLNNLSLGIYPVILTEREDVYGRYGRSRVAAYWSVVKVFARFQSPLRLRIALADGEVAMKTPLLFIARSAYQLREFGLAGEDAIRKGGIAVFAAPSASRWRMFLAAWRLVRRVMQPGEDFTLYREDAVTIGGPKRALVAADGEKFKADLPIRVSVRRGGLNLIHGGGDG